MEGAKVWLNDGVDISDSLVVCCFPSVGMVSSVVAHFLIDHLELELVGRVTHPKLPAISLVQMVFLCPQFEHMQDSQFAKLKDVTKSYF